MSNLFVGLMSGTSRDSLDGCLVSFNNGLKLESFKTINFSKGYQSSNDIDFISEEITNKSISLVKELIFSYKKEDIVAIAFPGQTISHSDEFSLQAGSPENLTKALDIPVFADFRNFDIARGGKGAPLIPEFHKYLLGDNTKNKIVFNIGGIANGTYLQETSIKLASDVGPGNCLMDSAMRMFRLGSFDKDGGLASKGVINNELINSFMADMQELSYPRADDTSAYIKIIEKHKKQILNQRPADALCTLTELTVKKIIEFIDYCDHVDELVFHGGGLENKHLMRRIAESSSIKIKTIDHLAPSKYIEAIAFAYLAYKKRAVLFK